MLFSSQQVVPFVGREAELENVLQMLQEPHCRLITLVGPGGMGKTRLALQIADLSAASFADACHWVDLQPVESAERIPQAIVDALQLAQSSDPLHQLTNYLRQKHLLLILDNFEHLLSGSLVLSHLLAEAQAVKMLVTSREALNLHEEWVHHLEGLQYPASHDVERAPGYPAVSLFVQSALRASSQFRFENEPQAVIDICQQVAGMPLALELAAAWTRTLSCADIAAEIRNGLGLLTARSRNMLKRHRSIQVLFEQTCAQLSSEEYAVLKRLSVFRGGFQREAAEYVAGALLPILTTLIDKSLLKRDSLGRYHMHELVRQYAAELLGALPDENLDAHLKHSAYYMTLLHAWEDAIMGAGQQRAIAVLNTDLDNIRLAWSWAVDHARVDDIQGAATTLADYCQIQSRYAEGATLFERAARTLDGLTPSAQVLETKVLIQAYQSGFYLRVGRLQDAEDVLTECVANYEHLGILPVPGFTTDPAFNLGILALIRGDYELASRYGEQMRQVSEGQQHRRNRQLAYHLLAEAAIGLGEYQRAERFVRQSLELLREAGNRWFMAYSYIQLGLVAVALKDDASAQRYFEASYTIRDEFNDPEGKALALRHLGETLLRQGEFEEARDRFEKGLAIFGEIQDQGGYAQVLVDLARIDMSDRDLSSAHHRLRDALEISSAIEFEALTQTILITLAELFAGLSDFGTARMLLSMSQQHTAILPNLHDRIDALSTALLVESETNPASPPTTVPQLLLDFPDLPPEVEAAAFRHLPKFKQSLIEPLTEREQEVLYYIVQGMSNRAIADAMVVSLSTVKTHINNLYGKLGVASREDAITQAQAAGLI